MSVYKEFFWAVGVIEKASKQIYSDACDYGALTKIGDNVWNAAKQLADWYGKKDTRKEFEYETGKDVSIVCSGMDEWNTGDTFTFTLKFVQVKGGIKKDGIVYDGYFDMENKKTVKGKKVLDY